jgi:putative oxidoreductase
MTALVSVRSRNLDLALLILRIVIGVVFIFHGSQKLFTIGIPGMTAGFTKFGVPLPGVSAPFISILEFAGGIALMAGLFTRFFAGLLACDMLGAMIFVHFKNGFSLPTGYEFVFTLCGIALTLALAGAGSLSVDAALSRRPRAGTSS